LPLFRAIGLMSGTSMDGVDVACIETDGEFAITFGPTGHFPYNDLDRALLRNALGEAATLDDRDARPGVLAFAEKMVTDRHAEAVHAFLRDNRLEAGSIDLVGFHGQTVLHRPRERLTVQIGDGPALAARLGVDVAFDFRAADVAAGGQGAPIVPFFHFALARRLGGGPVAFLNLGGVGNLTWADPAAPGPEAAGAILAFDTGPANAPIDDLLRARRGLARDEGGALAAAGRVDGAVLAAFVRHPHFAKAAPKSLDRDAFAGLQGAVAHLADADAAATLAACAARAVALGLALMPAPPRRLIVAGGGRLNLGLMGYLAAETAPVVPETAEAAGLNGDMLEAQAFAFLGMRVLRGLPLSAPGTTGVARPMPGGRIARP